MAHGPVLAKAGNRAIDQTGVDGLECFIADPQAIHHAGAEVFDQGVGGPDQPVQDFPARRGFQVQCEGTFAAVLGQERCPHVPAIQVDIRPQLTGQVARIGHFDLDDIGAQKRELIGAERPRQYIRQIQYADTRQGLCHSIPRLMLADRLQLTLEQNSIPNNYFLESCFYSRSRFMASETSGRMPRHNRKPSAAWLTSMPSPSTICTAPPADASCMKAVCPLL